MKRQSGPDRLEGEYEAKELDDGELLLIRPLTSYREGSRGLFEHGGAIAMKYLGPQ